MTKLADSGRVARLNPARAAALLPVLTILAACLTGQAQAQTDDLPWSTTMTVAVATFSSNAWGYGDAPGDDDYGTLSDTTLTYDSNNYKIDKLYASDEDGSNDGQVNLVVNINGGESLPTSSGFILEFAGAEFELDDASGNDGHSIFWNQDDGYLPSTSPLHPDNIRTTLVAGNTVSACLRTSTQVCPGGTTTTDLPWSTTMTVGEGTEHTVSGVTATPRGFNYDDYSNPYGALADEDFVHDSDVYEIANLAANPQYGDNAGGVTLIFDSGITNAQRNALILEFAGETLPLADVTASDNNGNYWNAAWVATNASSLTLANYRTTLPAGGTVNVCLRTSTQVCPGGTTTDPVWSTTMTVEVHTGSTVAWGYGLYNYGGTPDPSQNYGSLDDTTFTLGTNDFAISKLEARDSTNSLNENVFLRIEGTGLTDPTGLTLEWGGAELSLDDTSSASSGAFYWRRSDNKLPSTSPLAPDNIRTTLVPGSTVKACLRTSTQTCPDTSVTATVSTDATLSALTLEDGSTEIALSPEFVPATGVYTATVYNQTTALTLTAEKNDSNATVVITNDDDSSTPGEAELDLSVGSNTLTATVTAQSGATKTYTITVTRAAAPPAPSDCPADTDWCTTMVVGVQTTSTAVVTTELSGYMSTISVGDLGSTMFTTSGGDSYSVARVSRTKIAALGTATAEGLYLVADPALPDGTVLQVNTRTFTVGADTATVSQPGQEGWDILANPMSWTAGQNVTVSLKLPSDDATLSGLALKDAADDTAIDLNETFATATKSYTAGVANSIDEITVEPASDHNATFGYLDASDMALTDTDMNKTGFQATLLPGANTIKVKVTAEDGTTTDTYTVVVTRATATTDPIWLTTMTVGEGFSNGTYEKHPRGYSSSYGSLADREFTHDSVDYTVHTLNVSTGAVFFNVLPGTALADESDLVLEVAGEELNLSDGSSSLSGSFRVMEWDATSLASTHGFYYDGTDAIFHAILPKGGMGLVCLRTATQICPDTTVTAATPEVTIEADQTSVVFRDGDDADGDGVADGTASFTLTRTGETDAALTVPVTLTQDRSFLASGELSKQVTFAAGSSTAVLTFNYFQSFPGIPLGEVIAGGTLTATVGAGTGYEVGTQDSASVPIVIALTVRFEMDAYTIAEASGPQQVKVVAITGEGALKPTSPLYYSLSSGPLTPAQATSPEDYGGVSVVVEFPVADFLAHGSVFKAEVTVDFPIVNDTEDEDAEAFGLLLDLNPGMKDKYLNFVNMAGESSGGTTRSQITILDDDPAPTVTLVLTPESITEDGGSSEIKATLDRSSSETTTIEISAAAVSPAVAGDFTLSSNTTLSIPAGEIESDTDTVNKVTLTAVDNAVHSGNKSVTISGTATNDLGIDQPRDQTLTIEDDDIELDVKLFLESGESSNPGLDVRLKAPINSDVTVNVVSNDTDVFTVSPASFLFTDSTWDEIQDLAITPVQDADTDDETGTITLSGTGVTTATVMVLVLDDDLGLTLPSSPVAVDEGATATFEVVLASAPDHDRIVDVTSDDYQAVGPHPASLTFTTSNWSTAQTVTVTGVADADDTDEQVTITLSGPGVTTGTVTVDVTDNNTNAPAEGKPVITGAAQVGNVLTAGLGDIADDDGLPGTFPDDYTFQWVRVDADGVTNPINKGTDSPTYTVVVGDVGKKMFVEVSFTDGEGTAEGPLPSDAYPSNAPVAAAAGACPTPNDWCTTLTVGFVAAGPYKIYGFANAITDDALADTMIEYGVGTPTPTPFTVSHMGIENGPVPSLDVVKIDLDAFVPLGSVFNLGGTTFTADASSEEATTGQYTWGLPAGFAWVHGQDVTVSLRLGNFAATGAPGISGTTQVDQQLTAVTSSIEDRDGNTKAENGDAGYAYAYQWIRVDGGTDTDIGGATSRTYTLVAADEGKKVKVKVVSFKDDRDNTEGPLTSEAYPSSGTIAPSGTNIAPVFTGGTTQSRTLAETVGDATVGTAAAIGGPVAATDANSDPLTYLLEGTDAGEFDFDNSNGQISTKAGERYDYEANQRYSVTVTVNDGTVSVSAAVTIRITNNTNETPPAPDAPTVTPTSGSTTSLDVNWVAPDIAGRPIITGYDLRYREDGVNSWTDGPQDVSGTSESIPGLAADTAYEVEVRALNDDGDGAWSGAGDGRTAVPTPTVRFGASAYTAIEGVAGAVVTVLLDPAASRAVTISVTTDPRGGASSADYSGVPPSVTFAAGETEQAFTVTATDDTVDDDGESLQLGFDALPSGVLLGSPSTATVALVQDADVSTWYVWFGESSYTVTEGGTATISVHLNSPWKPELNEALTVPLFDPEHQGGATADDYSGLPESVTFQPGQTRASFTVRVTDDSEDDDGESVEIGFRRLFPEDLEVGRYGPHKTTLHIADNDGETAVTVSFDAANYTAAEGGATATVRVRLDKAPGRSVTIDLTKTHRGATAADYSGLPGSVTFGASETEKSFTVTATDDSADDDRESVAIGFGSLPSKVSAGSPSEAVVQLTDNDHAVPSVQVRFDASAGAVRDGVEEGGAYRLGVRLSVKPGVTLTIPLTYAYLGGATAADFSNLPANVTFGANVTSAGVTIRPVDDFEEDPGESLKVSFGSLPAGVSVSSWSGRSTIIPVIDNDASPGLSVSDASAREWPNKKVCLVFVVTMDLMDVDHEVSVNYATANGTAVAGQDFKPISGTLVFRPSESRRRTASKSLCVEVIDDSHDEGVEEMTLVLSNPVRAHLVDGTGTGYISNTDKMPGAWLTRFGRAATDHVVEAVGERWQGGPQTPHLTLGGRQAGDLFGWAGLGGRGGRTGRDTAVDRDDPVGTDPSSMGWLAPSGGAGAGIGATAPGMTLGDMNTAPGGAGGVEREAGKTLSGRAAQGALLRALGLPDPRAVPDLRTLLMGSSFFYSAALDEDGQNRSLGRTRLPGRIRSPGWLGEWSAWGRTASSRFSGADGNLALDGEVATAMLGFDSRWDRWLAGVVVSFSEGQGAYTHPTASGGAVASTMTGVNPYARFELNERTSVWGVLGYGAGDLSLTPARSDTALGTELANAMAAFGGRTALSVRTGRAGQFELALRSDARLTNTVSESIEGLVGTAGRTARVRLMLEGSGSMRLATGGVLKPKLEAGLRYDTGDAETGAGLEVGGGLGYATGRLSVEVNARGLVAHRDTEYEEWGFSGSIAYTPSKDGRGLSMRLGSAWGATQSGVQSLWSRQDASGLVSNSAFEAAQRYQVELRYGLDGKTGRARWEPFVGVESGEGASRALRLGVKLTSGRRLDAGLELGQRQGRPGADPEQAVQLRGALRW